MCNIQWQSKLINSKCIIKCRLISCIEFVYLINHISCNFTVHYLKQILISLCKSQTILKTNQLNYKNFNFKVNNINHKQFHDLITHVQKQQKKLNVMFQMFQSMFNCFMFCLINFGFKPLNSSCFFCSMYNDADDIE